MATPGGLLNSVLVDWVVLGEVKYEPRNSRMKIL